MNPLRRWYLLKMLTSQSVESRRKAARCLGEEGDFELLNKATAVAKRNNDPGRITELVRSYLGVCEPAQVIALYDASQTLTWCLDAHEVVDQRMISIGVPAVDHLLTLLNLPKNSDSLTQARRKKAIALLGLMGDMRAIRPLVDLLLKTTSENAGRYALANLRSSSPKAFKEAVQGYTETELCILGGATAIMIEDNYAKYKSGEKWLDEYYLPGEKSRYPWKGTRPPT